MNFYKSSIIVLLLLPGIISLNISSQQGYSHITNENGLSSNQINCIIQDKSKFIWIGTSDGLNLYNGYDFKVYRNIPGDSSSIPDNNIYGLFIDSKNNFWIGTNRGGICIYKPEKDAFERIDNALLTNKYTTGITEDLYGNIWISTIFGLTKYNRKTGKSEKFYCNIKKELLLDLIKSKPTEFPNDFFRLISSIKTTDGFIHKNAILDSCRNRYPSSQTNQIVNFILNSLHDSLNNSLIDNNVLTIYRDDEGSIWVGYEYEAFSKYDVVKKKFIHYPFYKKSPNNPKQIRVDAILNMKNEMYVGYDNGTVEVLDLKTNKLKQLDGLPNLNHIRDIQKIDENRIWIVANYNCIELNVNDKSFKYVSEVFKTQNDISNLYYNTIYTDKQNNTWLGSYLYGLYLLYQNKGFKIIDIKSGLSNENVSAISTDNNNIWLGYFTYGADCLTPNFKVKKRFVPNSNKPGSLAGESVFTIFCDKTNDLWITNYNSGLQHYNKNTESFTAIKANANNINSLVKNDIRSITEDSSGNLWLAVHGGGVSVYNKKTNQFKTYRADYTQWQTSLTSDWLYKITSDENGNMWIGTSDGLSFLDVKKNTFKSFMTTNSALPHNVVNDIYIDSYNNAWVGTKGGLVFIESGSFKMQVLTTNDGLSNNDIKAILQDNNGGIWISSNLGITKFNAYSNGKYNIDTIAKSICKFDFNDGIASNAFYDRSCAKTKDGRLFFGSSKGVTYFHPDSVYLNKAEAKVVFTSFKLFSNEVITNKEYDKVILLNRPIYTTDTITLLYKQNVLTFGFIALNFIQSFKNKFKVKMVGFDNDWRFLGNKNEVTYTNLSPGTYQLIVKACNNDDLWYEKGTTLTLIIKPPFWQTWIFRISIILITIGSILLYIKYRINKIRKQKIELEVLVKEKTEELQQINVILEERQEEVQLQNEQIVEQNNKLEEYSLHLEGMVEDRTKELVLAKNKAEESDRLKTAFLANMSHELRTPLNAIVGLTSYVISEDVTGDEKTELVNTISANSEMLVHLFSDIFELSKADAGLINLKISKVNIHSILKSIYNKYPDLKVHKCEVKWVLNIENENIDVYTDPIRLEIILNNLVSNAFKYTEKGEIELGFRPYSDNSVLFYVKDSGIGIAAEKKDSIFKRFVKIEEDKSKLYRGVGIGLALCEKLVTLMGGKIWFDSEVAIGSTFYFTIPIKAK